MVIIIFKNSAVKLKSTGNSASGLSELWALVEREHAEKVIKQ
jgi:hypothetical protein